MVESYSGLQRRLNKCARLRQRRGNKTYSQCFSLNGKGQPWSVVNAE